jgi:multimeric flavodoxin WrbA
MVTNSLHQANEKTISKKAPFLNILFLNCSPRPDQHTHNLLEKAGDSILEKRNLHVQFESFAEKIILPCQKCFEYCQQSGVCCLEDDFEDLAEPWLQANGLVIGSPVYTFGPPAPVLAFFERLHVLQLSNPSHYFSPNWPQSVGIIAQGGSEYGGVEFCAQTLISLCQTVGCIPISGDMPGCSQGVIGQVPDSGVISERLETGAGQLARRVVELAQIISAGRMTQPASLKFLIIKGGEFTRSNFASEIQTLLTSFAKTEAAVIEWEVFDFEEHPIAPCNGCTFFCSSALECCFLDGMQEFRNRWLSADAVIWLVGSRHGETLSNLQAAIDRMSQVRFEKHLASGMTQMPRQMKVAAGILLGKDSLALGSIWQRISQISMLYQNLLIPASNQGFGVLRVDVETVDGHSLSGENRKAMSSFVRQLAEFSLVVRTGLSLLEGVLPLEYYTSQPKFIKDCTNPISKSSPLPIEATENGWVPVKNRKEENKQET